MTYLVTLYCKTFDQVIPKMLKDVKSNEELCDDVAKLVKIHELALKQEVTIMSVQLLSID